VRKVLRQTEFRLFYLIIFLLIFWIVIERVNLREMAFSHDKSILAIPSGVVVFIAVLNSIAFSFISMVILDSIELDRVIGNYGMFTVMILAPLIPSGLISFIIFRNHRWVYYTLVLTLIVGLYLILSCFYCIG
jgi:hypothetical protein